VHIDDAEDIASRMMDLLALVRNPLWRAVTLGLEIY
jgi:hypothetical protein